MIWLALLLCGAAAQTITIESPQAANTPQGGGGSDGLGQSCVQTQTFTEILPLTDSQVVMQFNNIGKWRSDPRLNDLNDIAEHQIQNWKKTCITPALCDAQGKSVWSSDESHKNALFATESAAGAEQYNTDIPSGLLLSNAILFPDGTRGDLHVDVDVPSEWAATPWLYYQAVNHRATGFNGDFLQINQLSPNYYNNGAGPYPDGDFIRWYNPGIQGGSTTSVAGIQPGNPLTLKYKFTIYEHATVTQTNPMPTVKRTVEAIRISFFDLDHSTTPGCNADNAAAKAFSWVSPANTAPCTISSSGTNAQSASGDNVNIGQSCAACDFCGQGTQWGDMNIHILDIQQCERYLNGRNKRETGHWGQECIRTQFGGTGGASAINYVEEPGSTPVTSAVAGVDVPVGKSVQVEFEDASTVRVCGIELGFGADNPASPSSLVEDGVWQSSVDNVYEDHVQYTGYHHDSQNNWATQRTISMDGVDQKARSVLFVYENTDTIRFLSLIHI